MIVTQQIGYCGRLANQMFQYAALVGIAIKNQYDYGIPYENSKKSKTTQAYGHKEKLELMDEFNLSAKDSTGFRPDHTLEYYDLRYNESMFNVLDNTNMCGYFQSPKFFDHCSDKIKDEFSFTLKTTEQCWEKLSSFDSDFQVSAVHVRRTDYANSNGFHNMLDMCYYDEAISNIGSGKYVIFSDDIGWCKENFVSDDNKQFFFSEGMDQFQDMCLISMCKNVIMANSSFSWWGAYLNSHANTIIAPKKWLGTSLEDSWRDIYCEDWIKI